MKKGIIFVLVCMLMTTTLVSAFNNTDHKPILTTPSTTTTEDTPLRIQSQPTPFEWGLDQSQVENCGHGIILTSPWMYAQSFIPTKDKLTAVRLYMFSYGTPPDPVQLTVSIRDNLTNADLATKTIDTSRITIKNTGTWVLFDFTDIPVIPGNTYFIICSGNTGNDTDAYCWFYNNEDTYTNGQAWIKPDEQSIWTNFTHGGFNPDDYCFKTYYKKPLGGLNLLNNESGVHLWLRTLLQQFPGLIPLLRCFLIS